MQQTVDCSGGVSLRDVLPHGRFYHTRNIRVRSICSNARLCRPGDLYIALVDADGDGHDDVSLAVQRGATAVVAERLIPTRVPCCVVNDSREAYGLLCQRLAGQPDQHLDLIGITGTFGKTTTAVLITSVLSAADQRVGLTCSLGYSDSESCSAAGAATPPPPELARWLARMAANGCSHGVVEVSSEALASRQLAGVQFDAALLTNVRRDHLDLHGNMANYRRAKRRLFEHLKPGGFAVANADDAASAFILDGVDVPLITVGIRHSAQLQAQVLERNPGEQTFLLIAGQESIPVRTRTIGDAYVYCCLSAAAVGLVMGLDLGTIVRGLEAVEHVPGRMERIVCGQDFSVFVDRAGTPATLAVSLAALRQVTTGRVISVYGAPQRLDGEQRAALGRVGERSADINVITSDDPAHEPPLKIAHDVLDGFRNPGKAHVIPDRRKAIQWALSEARPGDAVLISGKGDVTNQTLANGPVRLDDREIATSWLRGSRPVLESLTSTEILPFRLGCQWN